MNGAVHRLGHVIAIGSNIDPENNIPRILRHLVDRFGGLRMSRILRTRPVGMASRRDFLNLAVFVETDLDAAALKAACNQIETALGRNRSLPDRAHRDRPADLDILFPLRPGRKPRVRVEGPYQRAVVDDLLAALGLGPAPSLPPGVAVGLGGVSAGEMPAAIHRQGGAGDEIVVQQCA